MFADRKNAIPTVFPYCTSLVIFTIELLGGRRGGSARGLRFYTNLASGNLDFRKLKKGVWHDRHHDSFSILRFSSYFYDRAFQGSTRGVGEELTNIYKFSKCES